MKKADLTLDRLQKRLIYDESFKGFLKNSSDGLHIRAGGLDSHGYRRIRIDGVDYLEHHLVIFLYTGALPTVRIYHRNGDPLDNRYSNLTLRKGDAIEFRQAQFSNRKLDIETEWRNSFVLFINSVKPTMRADHIWLTCP